MKFGISTKVMRDFSLKDTISVAGDLGYDIIEIWIDDYLLSGFTADEVLKMTEDKNLKVSVHLRTDDLNIASFNDGIREESLKQAKDGIYIASSLKAEDVTLHPGRKTSKTNSVIEAFEVQRASVKELSDIACEYGVKLCVEGMEKINGEFITSPEDLRELIKGCNKKSTFVTVDIAHLYTWGDVIKNLEYMKNFPVSNVHISQANDKKIHLPLFSPDGKIDYKDVFKTLYSFYDGGVVVEGYVKNMGMEIAEKSINWYKNIMRECEV